MRKDAAKKLPCVIQYVPDWYKTQEMSYKATLENYGRLESVPDQYMTHVMRDKAVDNYDHALYFIPDWYKTQKICNKTVNTFLFICSGILYNSRHVW